MALFGKRVQPFVQVELHLHISAPVAPAHPQQQRVLTDAAAVSIPVDLLVSAWRQLFPAERIVVFGGRKSESGLVVTSVVDVTEQHPSLVHVRACPQRLGRALLDFEHTGAHLAVWMHSHPGSGPLATYPSDTDTNQDRDFRRDYSKNLIGIIAVSDGWIRLFGQGIDQGLVAITWSGEGMIESGEPNVYRLKIL